MVLPGGAGRRFRRAHLLLSPGPWASSDLIPDEGLSHLHPLDSGLVPLSPMPRGMQEGFPDVTAASTKGQGTCCHPLPTSPRNYHRPWIYLWMFYFSTWR